MNFPIGAVPIPGRPQPFQQPQHYDPAQIIMQAAQMKQQRDLAEQQLQQRSLDGLVEAAQTAQKLQESKREADLHNSIAQQTLDITRGKAAPENALMQAHANYFNQMAAGGDDAVNGAIGMLKSGLASPQDIYSLAGRWNPNQKQKLMSALAQNGIDLKGMGLDLTTQKATIQTEQGSTFQQRIRGGESILPNFQDVVDQAKKLGLGSFAPANKIKLAALRQVNDPDVAKYDTIRSAVSEEMARYFGGGVSSDMKIKMGQAILGNDGANSPAIESALLGQGGAYDVIQNQVKAYSGKSRSPGGVPKPAATMRVKRLTDGQAGTIPADEFDPSIYGQL